MKINLDNHINMPSIIAFISINEIKHEKKKKINILYIRIHEWITQLIHLYSKPIVKYPYPFMIQYTLYNYKDKNNIALIMYPTMTMKMPILILSTSYSKK
eukprot:458107_1